MRATKSKVANSQKAIVHHNASTGCDCCEQLGLSAAASKHWLVVASLKDRNANQLVDLFVCLFVCLIVCSFVCLFVCLSIAWLID